MRVRNIVHAVTAAMSITACASLIGGSDQSIEVKLAPGDANCLVLKDGVAVAAISEDNRAVTTRRSRHDLVFECQAPGYRRKTVRVESSAPGWGALRCFVQDFCATRYETGALNSYPRSVTITLEKSRQGNGAQRN